MKTHVKTTYSADSFRKPSISVFNDAAIAQVSIDTCLHWGIGIVSCEIVPEPPEEAREQYDYL